MEMEKITELNQEEVKTYQFRQLNATDVFVMSKIISKVGINEFTGCLEHDAVKNMLASVTDGEKANETASVVGISVMLEVANVIFSNLPKCEGDIYQLLSQTSNLSVKEIKALSFVDFTKMVFDFIKKDEFKDFIKVVLGFLK